MFRCVLRAACCVLRLLGKTLSFRLERHSRSLEDNVGRTDGPVWAFVPVIFIISLLKLFWEHAEGQTDEPTHRHSHTHECTHTRHSHSALALEVCVCVGCYFCRRKRSQLSVLKFQFISVVHTHTHTYTYTLTHIGHAHVPLIPPAHPLAYAYRVL